MVMPGKLMGRLVRVGSSAVPTSTATFALGRADTPACASTGLMLGMRSADTLPRIMW